jgi:pimeloyl-ACP methyl ester carboxylesterase
LNIAMILASQPAASMRAQVHGATRWKPAPSTVWRSFGLALAIAMLGAALSGCAWIDLKQRELALRPTPGRPASLPPDAQLFRPGDERWSVPVPGPEGQEGTLQQLALWWLPNPQPSAPALLYLHGTFRNLYLNLPKIEALRNAGFSVLAVDYRGWGDSSPIVPSEETMAADAARAWAEMMRRQPLPGRRVIYGHSVGTAVAVRLAATLRGGKDYGALVLESAFTRLPDVAREAGFWGRVLGSISTLEFDSVARIADIDAPIVMLHGDADRTVPVALGRRLRDAAPPGLRWVEVAGGGHSQLHVQAAERYRSTFAELIARLPAPATLVPAAITAPVPPRFPASAREAPP